MQMFSDIFQSELRSKGKEMMVLMNGDMSVEHDAEDYSRIDNTISYEPETSINYEVGAHLNLFGGRVNADFSAFCMRINDQQLSVMADRYGYGRMMVNAGRSRSLGAEVAFRGNAFGGRMTWAATYSWVQSTFRRYTDSVTVATDKGLATEKRDYRGNHVPFVPQHNFSIMADWRMDISQNGLLRSMVLGVDMKELDRGRKVYEFLSKMYDFNEPRDRDMVMDCALEVGFVQLCSEITIRETEK